MGADPWSHDNKEWQATLDMARDFGFPTPRIAKSHGGITLTCPGGVHKFRIYSTAKGTEDVARSTRRKIRNCQHRDLEGTYARVIDSLDTAERWIDAGERLRDLNAVEADLADLVESVEFAGDCLADAERGFDELCATQSELAADVETAAEALGFEAETATVTLTANRADASLRTAQLTIRDELPKPGPGVDRVRSTQERLSALRARLERLRSI